MRFIKVEDDIRKAELQREEKKEYRQQKAKPLVDQFFSWHQEQLQRLDLVKSNPLSKALGYVNRREQALRVYLENPSVDIDTNHPGTWPALHPDGKEELAVLLDRGRSRQCCRIPDINSELSPCRH